MITFVRHGEKAFNNGKGKPKFDPELTKHFQELKPRKEYYNSSNFKVYSSPYHRCRQTALKFSDEIKVDCRIGEYLGHWSPESINPEDFHLDTLSYEFDGQDTCTLPPPRETYSQMKIRMLSFFMDLVADLLNWVRNPETETIKHIIVVSHAYPIETLFYAIKDNRTFSDAKKLSFGYVEGFTVRLNERDIIPTRYYNDTDCDWCDYYGYDSPIPLSGKTIKWIDQQRFKSGK